MKKFTLISAIIFVTFIGCSDKNNQDAADSELKSNASEKVKDAAGMSAEEINNQTSNTNVVKKYPLKSGIITFERKGFGNTTKEIVYFDEYGIKERHENYNSEGQIEEIRFTDSDKMYVINFKYSDEKVAYIMGPGHSGTEMKFIAEPFNNDEQKAKYGYSKLANIKIAGKDCESYSTKTNMGEVTFAGWNNILLYSKAVMSAGESIVQAIDIKENAAVEASLFKIPEGFEARKM